MNRTDNKVNSDENDFIYPFTVFLMAICLLSLVLNLISIASVLTARAFTTINLLIVNLALADFIYSLGIPMFITQTFSKSWRFGVIGCKLFIFTEFFGICVGILSVMALSVERYLMIASKKNKAEQLSDKFNRLLI